jgi:hypothetical protein
MRLWSHYSTSVSSRPTGILTRHCARAPQRARQWIRRSMSTFNTAPDGVDGGVERGCDHDVVGRRPAHCGEGAGPAFYERLFADLERSGSPAHPPTEKTSSSTRACGGRPWATAGFHRAIDPSSFASSTSSSLRGRRPPRERVDGHLGYRSSTRRRRGRGAATSMSPALYEVRPRRPRGFDAVGIRSRIKRSLTCTQPSVGSTEP